MLAILVSLEESHRHVAEVDLFSVVVVRDYQGIVKVIFFMESFVVLFLPLLENAGLVVEVKHVAYLRDSYLQLVRLGRVVLLLDLLFEDFYLDGISLDRKKRRVGSYHNVVLDSLIPQFHFLLPLALQTSLLD